MSELVDNVTLRTAVEAFAAAPAQDTYFEVLRNCFQGELLLDATTSTLEFTPDGSAIAAGSTLAFAGGKGPDGKTALFAFTRQAEAAKLHDDPDSVKTVAQSASSLIEFAAKEHAWLYIDPAGPTCAIEFADVGFAMRNHRNDAVKDALNITGKTATMDALAAGGKLLYAIDESGESPSVRTSVAPDGSPVFLAFTSAAEVVVRDVANAFTTVDISRVIDDALAEPFTGLVINPAGPWVMLDRADLLDVQARLAS